MSRLPPLHVPPVAIASLNDPTSIADVRDLAIAITNAVTKIQANVRDLGPDSTLGVGLGQALTSDLNLARTLADTCGREILDLGRALTRANALARDLGATGVLASDSAFSDSAPDPDLDLALDLARDLARAHGLANDLALALAHNLDSAHAVRKQRGAGRVTPLAGRLLAAAAHLLPAGDRARYAEEFRSELAEIARVKARRRPQLAYAARQVASAWRLRADLRAPRARKAAP
jgi:hypothetical protein